MNFCQDYRSAQGEVSEVRSVDNVDMMSRENMDIVRNNVEI